MDRRAVAIVPAAGRGRRFNPEKVKTFVELGGVALLIQTLKRLHSSEHIKEIIPVLRREDIKRGYELIANYGLNKIKRIVVGGRERQDSVYNGLRSIKDEEVVVLIHDGVRPIIPDGLIERLITEINGFDGIAVGMPLRETIKAVGKDGVVIDTVDRERFWSIQTPQVFHLDILRRAYQRAYDDGYYATDDAALVERIGGRVKVIMGSPYNIKITTPEDMEIVESLMGRVRLL